MKKLIALTFAASLSSLAYAAPETYVIEPTHTMPRFEYSHFGYSMQLSKFDKTSGKIVLDRAAKTGSVDVEIDTRSINTGYALFNEHIQAEDFFDTAKYPTATYKGRFAKFNGDKPTVVVGDLTLHGVTKPVTLQINQFLCKPHPMLKKEVCGADALATINRKDFGIAYGEGYGFKMDVTLRIQVEGLRAD